MDDEREFTIGSIRHRVTRRLVEERLERAEPEPIRKYFVVIGGRRFPLKQAVSIGLGISRASFQSQEAFRVLQALGFEPME